MKLRVEHINTVIGDLDGNRERILDCLRQAGKDRVDLLVLQEMTLCGYLPMDLLQYESFMDEVEKQVRKLVSATGSTGLLFGAPVRKAGGAGRPLYNAAILAVDGEIRAEVRKTLLPNYDVFDEQRYFEPNDRFDVVSYNGCRLGITICEDIWNMPPPGVCYHEDPPQRLREQDAQLLINLSASPFDRHKPEGRAQLLQRLARRVDMPVLFSNQVGANTGVVHDGDSMILDRRGDVVARTRLFEHDHVDAQWDADRGDVTADQRQPPPLPGGPERLFKALTMGIRDYIEKTGLNGNVLLGLSGGIDSALAAALACEAVGAERVTGITMPTEFSTEGSRTDALTLTDNLGMTFHTIPVGPVYEAGQQVLSDVFAGTEFSVAEENLQSRARGLILMAYSNKFGHLLLNTGNKSELAVGYCTLYGDMAGGLAVLSDVYKTEVYELAHWLNREYYQRTVIPASTLEKPPSAELRPGQKDRDTLPAYDLLDGILRLYIEEKQSAGQIAACGYDENLVQRIVRMVDANEYKRQQAPPGIRVSSKAFGTGRRIPIVQRWGPSG